MRSHGEGGGLAKEYLTSYWYYLVVNKFLIYKTLFSLVKKYLGTGTVRGV